MTKKEKDNALAKIASHGVAAVWEALVVGVIRNIMEKHGASEEELNALNKVEHSVSPMLAGMGKETANNLIEKRRKKKKARRKRKEDRENSFESIDVSFKREGDG